MPPSLTASVGEASNEEPCDFGCSDTLGPAFRKIGSQFEASESCHSMVILPGMLRLLRQNLARAN